MYEICEVDGSDPEISQIIQHFNSLAPEIFPPLSQDHLDCGCWWLAFHGKEPIAFAGLVTFTPFLDVGYFKRCYVMPDHVGHGLQLRLMFVREVKARELGYIQIISECYEHSHSNLNFRRAGFESIEPEQKWGAPNSVYWRKAL